MTVFIIIGIAALLAILAIWLGYPAMIWTRSRWRSDPIVPDRRAGNARQVSVVLATREAAHAIAARVENLLDTDHPADKLEIVIALDQAGSVTTVEELRLIPGPIVVVRGDAPGGKAATLNAGARAATGEILVLADTAQAFDRHTIPELVAHLEDPRFAAVSGALELGSRGRVTPVEAYWRMEKWLRYHESRIHSSIGVTGAVYATRRSLWPSIPAGTLLDDVFVPMKLILGGARVGFTYTAVARDVRVFDARDEARRKTRTLTGILQLVELVPDVMATANPVRFAFVMHKMARLATPLLLLICIGAALGVVTMLVSRRPAFTIGMISAFGISILSVPSLRRQAADNLIWLLMLQRATVLAVRNGMRRRWSVWGR